MKSLFYTCICFIISNITLYSQATLNTEVGLNYHPNYHRNHVLEVDTIKTPKLFIGLLGNVNISDNLSFQLRINYVFRQTTRSNSWGINPDHIENEFSNKELVSTFDVLYALNQTIKIGVGSGIIHKLNSRVTEIWTNENRSFPVFPRSLLSANIVLYFEFDRIGLGARYFYAFGKTNDLISFNITSANQGLAISVNYKLLGYHPN